jgi:hypothetical protein
VVIDAGELGLEIRTQPLPAAAGEERATA